MKMKNYEGKTTSIAYYRGNVDLESIIDRKIFSNRKLYPGDTWKRAHYIIFGYYPKDWDDMCSFTSNRDERAQTYMDENSRLALKYSDKHIYFDDYDAIYEVAKFILEKEPDFEGYSDSIQRKLCGLKSRSRYGGEVFGYLNSKLEIFNIKVRKNVFEKYEKDIYLCIDTDRYLVFDRLVYYFLYQNYISKKNPVIKAANYLDINSLAQVTDENQRFIFSAFLEVIQKICKQNTKKDNSMWDKLQEIMKSEKVSLRDFENKGQTPLFTLENTKVRFVFSNRNFVGIHFK